MNPCHHIGWFSLSGRESFHLHYGNRTFDVINEMADPDRQYPSLIFFIGKKVKDNALRQLFPNNNTRRGGQDGFVNLRLDSLTFSSDTPLMFADANPLTPVPDRLEAPVCHEHRTVSLSSERPIHGSVQLYIYTKLVAVFSDVVCIFADDFGGLTGVASLLVEWIKSGRPSTHPKRTRPRLIIVVREEEAAATYSFLETEDLRARLQQENKELREDVFASISLIHLPGDHISALARYRRLKEVLMAEIESARKERIEHCVQFSATHFNAFFQRVINHLATSAAEPFDFITSARLYNPIDDEYRNHMSSFLALGIDCSMSYTSLVSFLASSILMDAYPPKMHKFDPRQMFQRVYKAHCFSAFLRTLNSEMFANELCTCIEEDMEVLFPRIDLGFETSVQLHTNNIKTFSLQWTQMKSNCTCLYCLRRKPEHILTCGHAICDVCVLIFGKPAQRKEQVLEVEHCVLCLTKGNLVAKVKPPTAGARILSIDGGGVRGVVPLEFLALLQGLLASEIRVQDLFDQAFGTSSGGLIVLGLFLKHWEVARCCQIFDILTRDFFKIHMTKGRGWLTRLRNYFRCWLSDGCYNVEMLETSLKEIFGANQRLFDVDSAGVSGQKVAVTATTLSDASPYLFSNYNGQARDRSCGYKLVRPEKVENEPFIWEAGRVTSAAPGLFKPAHIASLGSFQDGGLRHNNPVDLALWECSKLWRSPTAPDVVLSLGTGMDDNLKSPKAPQFRHIINDGFIPRLFRSFMSLLDGERSWRDLINGLDESSKADYFRFNVPFIGDEPWLDEVESMDELRKSVHLQPNGPKDRATVVFALLAASFFFELDALPRFERGRFLCTGSILCRNNSQGIVKSLRKLYDSHLELRTETENLGVLEAEDICKTCSTYCKRVQFYVRRMEDVTKISIKVNGLQSRKISGFPHSILWFIHQQGLDAPFGRPDHGFPLLHKCQACLVATPLEQGLKVEKRRRRETASSLKAPPKRRRRGT